MAIKKKDVPVPSFPRRAVAVEGFPGDGEVVVQGCGLLERLDIQDAAKGAGARSWVNHLAAHCVRDADGERLWPDPEIWAAFSVANPVAYVAIVDAVLDINGLKRETVEGN